MRLSCLALAAAVGISGAALAQEAKPGAPAAPKITYDDHVRPILREHCFSCHSIDKQESGLQLDSYAKLMAGGSSGEVVYAGDLASSRLWELVSHKAEPKMPPKQDKLAAAKLDLISKWIEQGAPENAGSKVTIKKNPLAAAVVSKTGKPTPEEVERLMAIVGQSANPQQGLEDVFWAVLNSREFIFNH